MVLLISFFVSGHMVIAGVPGYLFNHPLHLPLHNHSYIPGKMFKSSLMNALISY